VSAHPTPEERQAAQARFRGQTPEQAKAAQAGPQVSRKTSSVIRHLDEFDPNKLLVVPYMRASTTEQRRNCNLRNRRRLLKRTLDQQGIARDESFSEVADGRYLWNRDELVEAIKVARALKLENPDAIVAIVTDARNRFIRGEQYNNQASTDPPSARQLEQLETLADGVLLVTVLDPDAPFDEVRRYETNVPTLLGNAAGKKVGRPKKQPTDVRCPVRKKEIRLEKISEARRLHNAGKSKRKIGRRLRVPESTVRAWLMRSLT
jgi:hypothetical protein